MSESRGMGIGKNRMGKTSARTSIRDPVHGTIVLDELETRIIDTPAFQRLRHIRQLGLTHLTYPGAHHTRFEHSLGALYLADRMARALGLPEEEVSRVRLAALLHDVGHMPFSHDSDEVVSPKLGDHEARGARMVRASPIADILSEQEDPGRIASYMVGGSFGQIIASDIGADRIDYLLRDAHYTGVAYGLIDWERIITTILWQDGKMALSEGGLQAAESLILARFSMFHTIYYHHSVRIARLMVQQAMKEAMSDASFDWEAAQEDGDGAMLERLSHRPAARDWVERIHARRMFKRSAVISWEKLGSKARKTASDGSLAKKISEASGCRVLVDLPGQFITEPKIRIMRPEGPQGLGEASALLSALGAAARQRATLLVCASEEEVEKTGKAAREILGLE